MEHRQRDFNPRIPRGMRPIWIITPLTLGRFQSTHPARDATNAGTSLAFLFPISIHASREGCDCRMCRKAFARQGFQSTHPARDATCLGAPKTPKLSYFNPRIPRGMRRRESPRDCKNNHISIHASREGCDQLSDDCPIVSIDFNPRIPRGMRQNLLCRRFLYLLISIHASREGCDLIIFNQAKCLKHFNPRIPRGMRHLT